MGDWLLRNRAGVAGAAAMLAAVLVADTAWGQRRGRPQRYAPSRPTVSPYLNLLRSNPSTIPNYYSFVRPEFRQQEFNRQQLELRTRQNESIRGLQSGLQQLQTEGPVSGSRSRFLSPGSRSTFRNTRGYFDTFGTTVARP